MLLGTELVEHGFIGAEWTLRYSSTSAPIFFGRDGFTAYRGFQDGARNAAEPFEGTPVTGQPRLDRLIQHELCILVPRPAQRYH
jgi:hypothetical protein